MKIEQTSAPNGDFACVLLGFLVSLSVTAAWGADAPGNRTLLHSGDLYGTR